MPINQPSTNIFLPKEMVKMHLDFFGLPRETTPAKPICEMTANEKADYVKITKEERKVIETGYTRKEKKVKEAC